MATDSRFMSGPSFGVRCLLRGLSSLRTPGLRRYIWVPLLINLIVYGLGFWAAGHYFSAVMDWLLPGWLDWLRWLLWPLLALSLMAVAFFTFTIVANVIGSPFYGVLAARVQRMAGELIAEDPAPGLVRDVAQSLVTETQRLGYMALRALPILLMFPIPGINLLATALWMVFGAWSLSLEYFSYPLENHGLKFSQQREFLTGRRLEILGFGGAVMLGLAVPVLNILIPPAAVIGATLYCQSRKPLAAKGN